MIKICPVLIIYIALACNCLLLHNNFHKKRINLIHNGITTISAHATAVRTTSTDTIQTILVQAIDSPWVMSSVSINKELWIKEIQEKNKYLKDE